MDIYKKEKCNIHPKQKEWTYTKNKSVMSTKNRKNGHMKKYMVKMF